MKNPFVDRYGVNNLGLVAGVLAFLCIICPASDYIHVLQLRELGK